MKQIISYIKKTHFAYLGSQPSTSAIPTNDNRNGDPTVDAWIASSRWPTWRASNFPNATIPPELQNMILKKQSHTIKTIIFFSKGNNYIYKGETPKLQELHEGKSIID